MAERVKLLALFRIGKGFVRFGDFLEFFLGSLVALGTVGMIFHGELAVRLLDFGLGSGLWDAERGIEVFFGHFDLDYVMG